MCQKRLPLVKGTCLTACFVVSHNTAQGSLSLSEMDLRGAFFPEVMAAGGAPLGGAATSAQAQAQAQSQPQPQPSNWRAQFEHQRAAQVHAQRRQQEVAYAMRLYNSLTRPTTALRRQWWEVVAYATGKFAGLAWVSGFTGLEPFQLAGGVPGQGSIADGEGENMAWMWVWTAFVTITFIFVTYGLESLGHFVTYVANAVTLVVLRPSPSLYLCWCAASFSNITLPVSLSSPLQSKRQA